MPRVLVVGAGLCGLSTVLMLAKDGHDVMVVERDPAMPAGSAEAVWAEWDRRGVNQFRMPHIFPPRWGQIIDDELPEVAAALEGAGGLRLNPLATAPDSMTGGWSDGDERFEMLTGRRPVVESVLAEVASRTAGIEVRRGAAVGGLRTGEPSVDGVPHVVGVRTQAGDDLDADLVVDTSGRRSPLPGWLDAIGARPVEGHTEDSGFVYFTRHFRSSDGSTPSALGGFLQHYDSVTTLTLPADNGTWGVGFAASAKDAALRPLSDPDVWMRAMANYPMVAHWADAEPLDDGPAVIAKIEDRHRRFVVNGIPVATGVVAVGDSWACTNPSLGRGASMGLIHVEALRDLLRSTGLDDPIAFARAWDSITDATVGSWYRTTLAFDRHRLAEIDAQIDGRPYRPEDPAWSQMRSMEKAAWVDPVALRAYVLMMSVHQTYEQVLAPPGVLDTVMRLGANWEDDAAPGPSRAELLSIVAGPPRP